MLNLRTKVAVFVVLTHLLCMISQGEFYSLACAFTADIMNVIVIKYYVISGCSVALRLASARGVRSVQFIPLQSLQKNPS